MDRRGLGKSGMARQTKPHFEQFSEDLDDLLNALGHAQVKLVGSSQGAYACLVKYKLSGFDRITNFFLVEHAITVLPTRDFRYGCQPALVEEYRSLVALWRKHKLNNPDVPFRTLPEEFRRAYANHFCATGEYLDYPIWRRRLIRLLFQSQCKVGWSAVEMWHGAMKIMEDYVDHDYGITLKDLEQIHVPVTLVYGRRSELFESASMLEMARHIPNAQTIAFENSGHACFLTEPIKFRKELVQFLAEPPVTAQRVSARAV